VSDDELSPIPVIDVDQAFPALTSDGRRGSSSSAGDASVTPTVEGTLRDVLGWRPRAQDASAFTAALTASFQLSEVEGHVVATYSPRGFAMQADLGAVSGGQASLYNRAVSARTQMLTLLDGLTALRPDADMENCEAFRRLVRDAITTLVSEMGTPGGPRVAVVDAFLRQLLGMSPSKVLSGTNADTISGQLGALRVQFGFEAAFVNNADQEGIRTAFWTLVDLALDISRAWVTQRSQFAGKDQNGFLGTQLVLINQLLSAAAEQIDEVEAALDSVYVSAAERQTIKLRGAQGLTLDGLLSWTRSFVTDEGPRIARDTGRDGMRTSFTPTVLDIVTQVTALLRAIGRPTVVIPPAARAAISSAPGAVQVPLITLYPQTRMPPGVQAARTQISISALDSLLWRLAKIAMRTSGYSDVVLFDAVVGSDPDNQELLVAVRGLNISESLVPVFRSRVVPVQSPGQPKEVPPFGDRTSYGDDTISAVFDRGVLDQWILAYEAAAQPAVSLRGLAGKSVGARVLPASALPITLRDTLTGKRVRGLQTRP
jgi:hypothetical protein